jgi:transposase
LGYLTVTNTFAVQRLLPVNDQGKDTEVLRRMRLLVRPETVLRWHRDLIRRRRAARSRPKRLGRPTDRASIRVLVLRLVRDNLSWGYRRVHGELLVLGVKIAAFAVWEILKDAGIDPRHPNALAPPGRLPAILSRRPAGLRFPGDRHSDRRAHTRAGCD